MRIAIVVAACITVACSPAASGVSSPTALPVASSQGTVSSSPSPASPVTPLPRGTDPLPSIEPRSEFAGLQISLEADEGLGQPAEAIAWRAVPFVPDADYAARVAAAYGVTGSGVLGAAPNGTAPWRLWLGAKSLAVNERTGDVLFFDPSADDGPLPPGPAVHDYAPDIIALLRSLGGTGELTSADQTRLVRGSDALALYERVVDGSWLNPGSRDAVAFFSERRSGSNGTVIYDADEIALVTARARPVELIHRPLERIQPGAVYPITLHRDAVRELKANPARYLRLLSAPVTGAITLRIDAELTRLGSAWAGPTSDITRANQALVPVWVFRASGTTVDGLAVTAVFAVDAAVPEFRAPAVFRDHVLGADDLLRMQLAQIGGHRPGLMSPLGAALDHVPAGCGRTPATVVEVDADTAVVIFDCADGTRSTLVMKHAFPGLPRSIWYVDATQKSSP